ncbi:MAG: hypothetical protein N2043_01755 [Ignavibacterium sp.]|nr:hypothetical protein [Ignavibacterium sp.]
MSKFTVPINMNELSQEFKSMYVQNLHGKEHMTVMGAVILATEYGIQSIETDLIQAPNAENGQTAIVKAKIVDKDGRIFTGIGDANPSNVNRMVAPAIIRMAETRALGRACRWLLGLNTLSDEIYVQEPITAEQINTIRELIKLNNLTKEQSGKIFTEITGKMSLANATKDEAYLYIQALKNLQKVKDDTNEM